MKILYLAKYPQPVKNEDYSSSSYSSGFFGFYQLKEINHTTVWYSHPRGDIFYRGIKKFLPSIDSLYFQITCVGVAKKYDVLYVGEDVHLIILAFLRAFKIIRTPVFSVSHFSYNTQYISNPLKKIYLKLERYMVYRFIDKISFASDKLLELALKDFKVPQRHRNIANWGANIDYYNVLSYVNKNASEDFFLATGGTNRDYDTLVECFKMMPHEKLLLNAKYKEYSQVLTNNIVVNKTIHFDADKMLEQRSQMYDCIAVLLPIKEVNQVPNGATVMVEAMAMGKPVIITDLDTNFVDVEKEGIGLTVKRCDANDWVRAITWIKNHPNERQAMGKRAYFLAKNKYNINIFVETIYEQMKEMCNK